MDHEELLETCEIRAGYSYHINMFTLSHFFQISTIEAPECRLRGKDLQDEYVITRFSPSDVTTINCFSHSSKPETRKWAFLI